MVISDFTLTKPGRRFRWVRGFKVLTIKTLFENVVLYLLYIIETNMVSYIKTRKPRILKLCDNLFNDLDNIEALIDLELQVK